MIKGSCHCGRVAYESAGKVLRFVNCHCDDCRKVSGAPFSSSLGVESSGFRITKGKDNLSTYESSPGKFRWFCTTCASPIYARRDSMPDVTIIRAGVLDDLEGAELQAHIWVKAKVSWCDIRDDLPQYPEAMR